MSEPLKNYRTYNDVIAHCENGEMFSFTFGTLAHYDECVLIDGNIYTVRNGKPHVRLYV